MPPERKKRRYSAGGLLPRSKRERYADGRGELAGNADVLVASSLVFFCVVGSAISAPPTLYRAIAASLAVDVDDLQLRLPSMLMLSWLVATAGVGVLMDRIGVAPCVRLGAFIVALASTAYPLATSHVQLIVLHAVLGIGMALAGVFAQVMLMNCWFAQKRGAAIAIVVAFFGIANAAWPPVLAAVATASSWQHAMWLVCAAQWLVALPLAHHLVRRELGGSRVPCGHCCGAGELGEGGQPSPRQNNTASSEKGIAGGASFLAYLRTPPALALVLMSLGVGYVLFALQNILVTFFQTRARMPLQEASAYFAVLNVAQICGKLAFGAALDSKLLARPSAVLGCGLALAGCALLLRAEHSLENPQLLDFAERSNVGVLQPDVALLRAFVVVYGLGIGSSFALLASVPGREFRQLECFPELQACFSSAYLAGGLSGVACSGELVSADGAGGYGAAFGVVTMSAALVLLSYIAFELAPRRGAHAGPAAAAGSGSGGVDEGSSLEMCERANSPFGRVQAPSAPRVLALGRSRSTRAPGGGAERQFAQLLESASPHTHRRAGSGDVDAPPASDEADHGSDALCSDGARHEGHSPDPHDMAESAPASQQQARQRISQREDAAGSRGETMSDENGAGTLTDATVMLPAADLLAPSPR